MNEICPIKMQRDEEYKALGTGVTWGGGEGGQMPPNIFFNLGIFWLLN
jgi:hypothetical protein